MIAKRFPLVSLRSGSLAALLPLLFLSSAMLFAQQPTPSPDASQPVQPSTGKNSNAAFTAEQIVESTVFIYGFGGGRAVLDQIRKSAFERGKATLTNPDGRVDSISYQRWTRRGDKQATDQIRFEQDFANARYSLLYKEAKVMGIYNDSVFTPNADALRSFENLHFRNIEALLRYKENESKIELGEREKIMGVEFYVIDLTDKEQRKTRYYISVKSLRVMMLEYEDGGQKFRRRFYDYRNSQGTLVPFRTVLWAQDKIIEESSIGTITFGQKIDDAIFVSN